MRNLTLGVAAVALAISGAHAQPGKNDGNGNGNGNGGPAKSVGGPDKAKGGPGNGAAKAQKADRGPDRPDMAQRGNGNGNAKAKFDRVNDDVRRGPPAKAQGQGKFKDRDDDDYRDVRIRDRDDDRRYRDRDRDFGIFSDMDRRARGKGLIDGCPPGLAKKNNGCNPPGLVKNDSLRRYDRAGWWGLPGLGDGRYRYHDGYMVRLGDGGISGWYPLLGGALSVGNAWPSWYDSQPVPRYYENYYGLGSSYRYADNALYRVDPETAAITSIAALLTGDTIRVGQPMPSGYSVYNVPYDYRDRYYDSPDRMYRYSDGYVYEIDPATMLVASAIDLVL